MSPYRYILECRVRRTQELLRIDLALSEIAIPVDFSDQRAPLSGTEPCAED